MGKCWVLVLLVMLFYSVTPQASASVCRNHGSHRICIVRINRSAKNYWEYRAVVSVDGEKKPLEIYNCRTMVKVTRDGTILPFEPNGAGELICSFFRKSDSVSWRLGARN
ncbi:hypothetical protein [Fortiea contorta]|uniref:hypothetical protein n=1 Tax=Fortiea contorta TaxID=1892405 RepID=UPI000345F39C|nr:hypothetical protein [Fortiea contorta]